MILSQRSILPLLAVGLLGLTQAGCETTRNRVDAVDLYREAEQLFSKGEYEECKELLEEGYEIAPDYAQLRRDLGMVNFELGKLPMFDSLRHAAAAEKGSLLIQRFDVNNDGRAERDEVKLEELTSFDVDRSGTVDGEEMEWARNLFTACDFNGDGAVGQDDVATHKEEADRFKQKAMPFFKDAKKHYDYAIQQRPHEPMPYYNLARIYSFEGNLRAARQMLIDAISIGNPGGDMRQEMEAVLYDLEEALANRAVGPAGPSPARPRRP